MEWTPRAFTIFLCNKSVAENTFAYISLHRCGHISTRSIPTHGIVRNNRRSFAFYTYCEVPF